MAAMAQNMLVIDGSYGEGGGQILRTALSLSAITGRPLRIEQIRAGRPKPGLAAQHLTAILATAAVCRASVMGGELGSMTLEFSPTTPPIAGTYEFDVAEAREGGSAGAATLVLQTLCVPLGLLGEPSTVAVKGGTHVPWSPSFDYLRDVWLKTLGRLGIAGTAKLDAWGFYPAGGGGITMELTGSGASVSSSLQPLSLIERGPIVAVEGRAVAANLPSHIAQRMTDRAEALLRPLAVPISIKAERVRSVSPGAGIYLTAIYENAVAGFSAWGRKGKPAEEVAEEAISDLLDHHGCGAALDRHMADQILLPLAFAGGSSEFTCPSVTRHLQTNAWVIELFGVAGIEFAQGPLGTGLVTVIPNDLARAQKDSDAAVDGPYLNE